MAESKTDKMRSLFADKELSAEQLEDVAGGTTYQISADSRFLNVLLRGRPDQCDRYGEYKVCDAAYGHKDRRKEIENTYIINGQPVTWQQAWIHAQKVVGKTLKRSDWDWPD